MSYKRTAVLKSPSYWIPEQPFLFIPESGKNRSIYGSKPSKKTAHIGDFRPSRRNHGFKDTRHSVSRQIDEFLFVNNCSPLFRASSSLPHYYCTTSRGVNDSYLPEPASRRPAQVSTLYSEKRPRYPPPLPSRGRALAGTPECTQKNTSSAQILLASLHSWVYYGIDN